MMGWRSLAARSTFGAAGAAVVANDLVRDGLDTTLAEVEAAGGATVSAVGDVRSPADVRGLVELAIDWTLTETPYLGRGGTMPSSEQLFQLYREEFDGAYELGTMFVLTLHPHVTGHRAPMRHLEQLVAYMKSKPGVWFATGEQIARYVKTAEPRP